MRARAIPCASPPSLRIRQRAERGRNRRYPGAAQPWMSTARRASSTVSRRSERSSTGAPAPPQRGAGDDRAALGAALGRRRSGGPGRPVSSTVTWPGPGSAAKVTSAVSSGSVRARRPGRRSRRPTPASAGRQRPVGERRLDAVARLRPGRRRPGARPAAPRPARRSRSQTPKTRSQRRLDRLARARRGQHHRQHQRSRSRWCGCRSCSKTSGRGHS